MSAMSKLMAFAVAVAGIALVVSQSAAVAATSSFDDKTGDASARFDLTGVTFGNSEKSVSVKSEIRDLLPAGVQTFGMTLRSQGIDGSYAAYALRDAEGAVTTDLWRYDGDGAHHVDCNVRARWRPGKDVVRLRFPQSCLPDERRVFVSAFMIRGDDTNVEPADWTRTVPVPFD
jgi:hypothetical protein